MTVVESRRWAQTPGPRRLVDGESLIADSGFDLGPTLGAAWVGLGRRVLARRSMVIALVFLLGLAVVALLAPYLAPYDPNAQPDPVGLQHRPPSATNLFGTDRYSRDVFSRVVFGTRVSLAVAFLAVSIAAALGTVYGAIAGYAGGVIDTIMMRVIDAFLSIPRVLLLIGIVALWGSLDLSALILLLGLTGWFGVSRLVRAQVIATKGREFILSARALGTGHLRILARHILPHVLAPVFVAATLGIAHVIVIEAGLSFLGIGIAPPTASWGNIIRDGDEIIGQYWWVKIFPGLALLATVLAVNVVADGLREALDPRQLPAR